MKLRLLALLSLAVPPPAFPAGKEITGERAPAQTACPSPEEARVKMTVPAGYEVRCFAHEPMVQNPVAMTWDHRGRLWVVEAYEYPEGSPHPAPFGGEAKDDQYHPVPANCLAKSEIQNQKSEIPRDRIIILEDTDNDGAADKRTVFLQGLNLASAILCGDGGIYVGQQPHLLHFRDDDGDDKPDAWRICLTGFGREDTHELLNSFCWGPDGWLYMTHGVFTNSKVRRPGQPESEGFKFDAGIGRARPIVGRLGEPEKAGSQTRPATAPPWEFEVFADGTSNPWGCDYDAAGNFFVSACVIDHLFHMAPGGIYVRQGGAPENPHAYELLPSIVKHKHFRAAYAGVQIYQGGRYPQDTWGHCFIGNIHDNAIHEEIITPAGASFKAEPRRDFLRANDGWFRPVSTQTGPDGFLWIMDWCDKYPCYQNAKANPEGVDRERGRIWRVVWSGEHGRPRPSAEAPSPQSSNNNGAAQASESSAAQAKDEVAGEGAGNSGRGRPRSPSHAEAAFSPGRMSLIRDKANSFRHGTSLASRPETHSAAETTRSIADTTQSAADSTQSALDTTQSVTDTTQSAADSTLSATDSTQSVTDSTQSAADTTQSVAETTLSATDTTQSVSDLTQSVTDLTLSVTERVKSGPEKAAFFIKTTRKAAFQDQSRPETALNLKNLPTADLVKLLEHPNNWMRRMARRMLVERSSSDNAQEALRTLVLISPKLSTRLEALWTLHQTEAHPEPLDANILGELGADKEPALRAWSARLSGERFRSADRQIAALADGDHLNNSEKENASLGLLWRHTEQIEKQSADPDITVRFASAIALQMTASSALTVTRPLHLEGKVFRAKVRTHLQLGTLVEKSGKDADRLFSHTIWQALEPGFADFASAPEAVDALALVAPQSQPLSRTLAHKAMRRLCDTRKAGNMDLAVEFCEKVQQHDILLAHALDGLVKGQEGGVLRPTVDVSKQLAAWRESKNAEVRKHAANLAVLWGDAAAADDLLATISNEKAPMNERLQALQTVRKVRSDAVRAGLLKVVQGSLRGFATSLHSKDGRAGSSPQFEIELIRAIGEMGGKEAGEELLKVVQGSLRGFATSLHSKDGRAGSSSRLQLASLEALSSRTEWAHAMLDAITGKKIPAEGFPISVRRSLAQHGDKAIRDHAFRVLGAWQETSDDIKAVIAAKKKMCLEGEPDLANGKILFTATCGVCHVFHGGGQKVGPDLIGSGRSNLDALLANVIDPNQIIGNGYEAVNVTAKDGRLISGRMIEDTPGHVKLLAIGGAEQTVPREQIAKLENTKQSLMPMGFGALPDAAIRDLIWYILSPPEEGPLTAEKKKMLSQSIDLAPPAAAKPKGTNWRAIDWESVSLWSPDWKVSAPDFERTPVKLAEYHGKTNVLLMHPFPDKKTPASLERKFKVEPGKTKLVCHVAADDRGDWKLKATVNGQVVKEQAIDHEQPRWKAVEIDLAQFAGQEITVRLEAHATDWSWEFAYWGGIELK